MKKHRFRSIDVVIVTLLIVFIVGSGIAIVQHKSTQDPKDLALRMAENISSQLLNLDRKKFHTGVDNASKNQRRPSGESEAQQAYRLGSEGTIGHDPWGQPFQYRFVEGEKGQWSHLIVWSAGPDSRLEKAISEWSTRELVGFRSGQQQVHMGDDVGLVIALSN